MRWMELLETKKEEKKISYLIRNQDGLRGAKRKKVWFARIYNQRHLENLIISNDLQ